MSNADSFESYIGLPTPTPTALEKCLNLLQTTLAYNLLHIRALNTWPGYVAQYIISEPSMKVLK
jgi:hypothetical protein